MPLELDTRHRAMLREMGVHVWLPESAIPPVDVLPAAQATTASVSLKTTTVASPATPAGAPAPGTALVPVTPTGEPLSLEAMDWQTLAQTAASCQACGLCAGRKNTTLQAPSEAIHSDWLVLGDPPDEDEDRLAQAFAGPAGVLLDNMLKAAGARRGGRGRNGAYASNVVKCRPSNGRLPHTTELQQCAQYLQREVALVQPKLILAMGRFATQLLLQDHPQEAALPLGKQRGVVYRYQGIPVVVTYHPKVLLRASADKAKAWADLCLAMDVLDT